MGDQDQHAVEPGGAAPSTRGAAEGAAAPLPLLPGWVGFRIGYQPAFNGFRGLAITMFIVYHGQLLYRAAPGEEVLFTGSFLWLDMFFVQSAFLICSLLFEEWRSQGAIHLGYFYLRRAVRLMPALAAVVLFTAFWLLTFAPEGRSTQGWDELWSTVFYVNNWRAALADVSDGLLPLYLSHCWSLSLEEQFYLVAPLAMMGALAAIWTPRRIAVASAVLAAVSAGWMVLLAAQGAPLNRMYYSTGTRAQSFLIGAAAAAAAAGGLLFVSERSRRAVRALAPLAIGITVVMLFGAHIDSRAMYYGFFTLSSLCFVVILVWLVQEPGSWLGRTLRHRPFLAAGQIAYGLYLWHWPVMLVTRDLFPDLYGRGLLEWPVIALQLAVTFAIATASWRFLEAPLLRWGARFGRVGSGNRPVPPRPS